MSKKTYYLLGIALTIILGTILYYFLCCSPCCNEEKCKKKSTETKSDVTQKIENVARNALNIKDPNGNFSLGMNDNFNFKTSNFSILNPISENVEKGALKLKDYLQANPLKTLDVTGFYKSDETNSSAYPNLGIARANSVKNYLVLHGVSAKQIDTYGTLNKEISPDKNSTFFGPLKFKVLTTDPSDTSALDALKATCDSIRANPLILYFKTGQASINLTAAQRKKLANISHCVDKLGVKMEVIGHTDSAGNANNNVILGQKRANFAKDYLTKNGILETNIKTSSKGPHVPIADNTTEAGRAKNRRTVITIN